MKCFDALRQCWQAAILQSYIQLRIICILLICFKRAWYDAAAIAITFLFFCLSVCPSQSCITLKRFRTPSITNTASVQYHWVIIAAETGVDGELALDEDVNVALDRRFISRLRDKFIYIFSLGPGWLCGLWLLIPYKDVAVGHAACIWLPCYSPPCQLQPLSWSPCLRGGSRHWCLWRLMPAVCLSPRARVWQHPDACRLQVLWSGVFVGWLVCSLLLLLLV